MKRIAKLLFCSIVLLLSIHCHGQVQRTLRDRSLIDAEGAKKNKGRPDQKPDQKMIVDGVPQVLLGTIATPISSREKILAYPRLIPQALDCEVLGFSFTLTAGDKIWNSEPVKGAVFTEAIKDKIKETESPTLKITINDIKLKYNGNMVMSNPIVIEYDH